MKHISVLNNASRAAVLSSVLIFGLSGLTHAAGAGDQVREHGSMAGQGDRVAGSSASGHSSHGKEGSSSKESKQGASSAGQGKSGNNAAPEEWSKAQGLTQDKAKGSTSEGGSGTGMGSSSSQGSSTSGTSSGSGGY